MKKIFLTGGTGFFGKSILDMLRRGFAADCSFTILSRDPGKFQRDFPQFSHLENVRFLAGDVKNFAFPQENFDCIIHAATPAVTTLEPGEMRSIILEGTRHVLDFAHQCRAVKLLFTSSGAVYGVQEAALTNLPETHPCRPVTEYGIAKLEAEEMCKASGIYTLLPRCFAFTGPYLNRNIHFAIGNFIRDCLAGNDVVIRGDGTPFRSYLYADDLVQWLFAILERGENGRPYNVGSPEGLSIYDLAVKVRDVLNSRSKIKVLTPADPSQPVSRYVPDTQRIQSELHLSVGTDLAEAIRKSAYF